MTDKFANFTQSELWDMNISLEELIKHNPICKLDRNYKAHKYDDCFHGYCMYVTHPKSSRKFETMIGIREDGFVYIGDGAPGKILPVVETKDAILEMEKHRDKVVKQLLQECR